MGIIKKIAAWLLIVALIGTLFPTSVLAENSETDSKDSQSDNAVTNANVLGGSSTKAMDDYVVISTAEELFSKLNNDKNGKFKLGNDIDLSTFNEGVWKPIGTFSDPFTGKLNGDGHTINNMKLANGSGVEYPKNVLGGTVTWIGLFGYATKATISNLYVNIAECNARGESYINLGGIIGYDEGSTISNVSVSGQILQCTPGTDYWNYNGGCVGGIVGCASCSTTIINAHNSCDTTINADYYDSCVGGITGKGGVISRSSNSGEMDTNGYYGCSTGCTGGISGFNASVSESYNTGNVYVNMPETFDYGFAGGIIADGGKADNCYNTGNIICCVAGVSSGDSSCGIGKVNTMTSCYSVGNVNGTREYYISGSGDKSEKDMSNIASYPQFDFKGTWSMPSDNVHSYPMLRYNTGSISFAPESYVYGPDVQSYLNNKGTLNMLMYSCNDKDFPSTMLVAQNDATFGSNLVMTGTDLFYRGIDGWRDLFTSEISQEDAEKTIAGFILGEKDTIDTIAKEKTAQTLASDIISGLDEYGKVSAVSNSDIADLKKMLPTDELKSYIQEGKFADIKEIIENKGVKEDSSICKLLDNYTNSQSFINCTSSALDSFGDILNFYKYTSDCIDQMYRYQCLVSADKLYSEMLLNIKQNCCYSVVCDAADELYRAINGTVEDKESYMFEAFKDAGYQIAQDTIETIADQIVVIKIIKNGFKWGADISNLLFHTGDTQHDLDRMRTTVYLGNCISRWVLNNFNNYLSTSSNADKEKNARIVLYGYSMLLQCRIDSEGYLQDYAKNIGEEHREWYTTSCCALRVLKSAKGMLMDSGLINSMFTNTIACPVDVEVFNKNGELVLTVLNGKESEGTVDGIYYYEAYYPIDNDYIKIIQIPEDRGYFIKCKGTDLGTVNYTLSSIKDDGKASTMDMCDIAIQKNTELTVTDIKPDSAVCTVKNPDEKAASNIQLRNISEDKASVSGVILSDNACTLAPGEKKILKATVYPADAANPFVTWSSDNDAVVTVNKDGIICSHVEGTATITATTIDGGETGSCVIKVVNSVSPYIPTPAPLPAPTPVPSEKGDGTGDSPSKNYQDIDPSAWYRAAIDYVIKKGIMIGTEPLHFEPDRKLTRAELILGLYQQKGKPAYITRATCADLISNAWYMDAISWALELGIIKGSDNGFICPDDPITREQVAVILYRFNKTYGADTTAKGDLSTYTDSNQIHDYAAEAMQWAVGDGIIQGDGKQLSPNDTATRAQIAAILMRVDEKIKK